MMQNRLRFVSKQQRKPSCPHRLINRTVKLRRLLIPNLNNNGFTLPSILFKEVEPNLSEG